MEDSVHAKLLAVFGTSHWQYVQNTCHYQRHILVLSRSLVQISVEYVVHASHIPLIEIQFSREFLPIPILFIKYTSLNNAYTRSSLYRNY